MTITDIIAEARDLVDATATSYPDASILRRLNPAEERIVTKLINADGTWQFDDTNYTDLPIGLGTLVEGQDSYTFASDYLSILSVKVKDQSGNWFLLKPIDQRELKYPLEEFSVDDGLPEFYDKLGDTIRLIPAPTATDVTLASGFKVEFKRKGKTWTQADITTGTRTPGFSLNHIVLAYELALPEAMKYKRERVTQYERKIEELTKAITDHYSLREKDEKTIISTNQRPFK